MVIPRRIVCVPRLPREPNGELQRDRLLSLFGRTTARDEGLPDAAASMRTFDPRSRPGCPGVFDVPSRRSSSSSAVTSPGSPSWRASFSWRSSCYGRSRRYGLTLRTLRSYHAFAFAGPSAPGRPQALARPARAGCLRGFLPRTFVQRRHTPLPGARAPIPPPNCAPQKHGRQPATVRLQAWRAHKESRCSRRGPFEAGASSLLQARAEGVANERADVAGSGVTLVHIFKDEDYIMRRRRRTYGRSGPWRAWSS
jgi:hypothetical protein